MEADQCHCHRALTKSAESCATESINCLYHLCLAKHTICLLGDFNLPAMDWTYHRAPNNGIYRLLLEFFSDCELHQFVTSATCHDNILDLIFSNDPQFIKSMETMCPISTSDRNVIVLRPNTPNKPNVHHQSSPTTSLHNFKKGNYSMINDYLSQVDWNALFQFCSNVHCCWKEFRYQKDLAIEMFVPKLTLSDRKHKSKYPYFFNKLLKTKSTWPDTELTRNCQHF